MSPPSETVTATVSSTTKVKLPKLSLKKFNGDESRWTSFWDSFESAVHRNTDLSDVDKFNYLTSMIEHSASEAIAGLSLTASNYKDTEEEVWEQTSNCQQTHGDSLRVTSDAYGTLLSSVLMNKLPSELRLVVSRHIAGDN